MGIVEFFLCIFAGHVITVQSVIHELDARFPQDFAGLFDNIRPFDLSPYDSIFSSWRNPTPEFQMFAEFPPIMNIPQVEVFCDESKLTLLVNKRSNGVILTGEEIQLGYGCFSNGELPNQFVFTYSLDECGTTRVMQNGLGVFTNTLHLNTKNLPNTLWPAPSTVHISCIPKRSYEYQNLIVSTAFPKDSKTINIKAMNPSWYGTADSNVYERGQVINVQVSARTRHEQQQLYIQSCFVSASPEPQIKPRHAVIMNKGCTVPLGSPHAVVQFVTSNRADVVNFHLNTSYLISELYIHCSVLISDQGVTFGSKSCNYNVMKSRWEDLSGTADVCECCSSKCKGLSIRHLPDDAKAVVTTGPFVIVDKEEVTSPEPSVSDPQETSSLTDSMQSDSAAATDMVVAGTTLSRHKFSHTPQGVVVVSKDPVARLTLWLPGHIQETEHGEHVGLASEDKLLPDIPELQSTTIDQESLLNTKTNIGDQKFNLITLVDGWVKLPHLEEAAIKEENKGKRWFERSGMFNSEAPQEVVTSLPAEIPRKVLNKDDINKSRDERQADAAVAPKEGTNAARPIIRTKLQFSKGADGSQVLSYEEELKQQEGKDVTTRLGMEGNEGKQEHRPRGMFKAFLDLLRRMSKQE